MGSLYTYQIVCAQYAGFPMSVGSDLSGSFWTERKGLSAFAQASKVESKLCQKQDEEAELSYKR